MHQINHLPPDRMTPEQRRLEIASLLANGLARLRISGAEQSANIAEDSEFMDYIPAVHPQAGRPAGVPTCSRQVGELGFSGNQRVHSDPVNKTTTESK